jgi:microcystin-dependent protein
VDPFLAEIRIFAGNFAPRGWALCDGSVLAISQNTALFSLLGTNYGGNGTSTFALPDLQGKIPMSSGQGPGLTPRSVGESSGTQTVALTSSQLPIHGHTLKGAASPADQSLPAPNNMLAVSTSGYAYQTDATHVTALHPAALAAAGGGLPHNNMPPYLALTFIIALQGIFPPRP